MIVRPTVEQDIPDLERVLDGTGLFPKEMLPDMLAPYLADSAGDELWLTCEKEGRATGFCYAAAEAMTEGTWNMLALAVSPEMQDRGVGSAIVSDLEKRLCEMGHRVLIVDTSGSPGFERTRNFYRANGYAEEARIRDFWSAGDDKIVFWKALR